MILVVRLNCRNRTGKVVLLSNAIADYNNLIKRLCSLFLEENLYIRRSCYHHRLITDVGNRESSTLISLDSKVSIEVSHNATVLSYNTHSSTNNVFAGTILNMAIHSNLLCKGTC